MQIIPTSVVKDDGRVYQPDIEYDVDEEVGRRFVTLGWATSPQYTPAGAMPALAVADVDAHSITHASTTKEV